MESVLHIITLLFIVCVNASYEQQYQTMLQEWDVPLPPYSEKIENDATRYALSYVVDFPEDCPKYKIPDYGRSNPFRIMMLVNSTEEVFAMQQFISIVSKDILEKLQQGNETYFFGPLKSKPLKEGFTYTVAGGISVHPFEKGKQYFVVAAFEFGWSHLYKDIAKEFSTFPIYGRDAEFLAHLEVQTKFPQTCAGIFEGSLMQKNGHFVIIIRSMVPYKQFDTETWVLRQCKKALKDKSIWKNALSINDIKLISNEFETLQEVLESKLPMHGGITITKKELSQEERVGLSPYEYTTYQICICFLIYPTSGEVDAN